MKLIVAGYNIDSSLIAALEDQNATPEVISAAYARISRSQKSVEELRKEALVEIEKARKSNENIIFEMGHASIAEHAVYNIDIIGVSRWLTDTIQRSRIASFTEKSQRYVTFRRDYIIPEELKEHPEQLRRYKELSDKLFREYEKSYQLLDKHYQKRKPEMKVRERQCMAKEDARYILPMSTKTQMGMTINARSLENLLRRLAKSNLLEAKELHELIMENVAPITPSLLRYIEDDGYNGQIDLKLISECSFLQQELPFINSLAPFEIVKAMTQSEHIDDLILAGLIYEQSEMDWGENIFEISELPASTKNILWEQVFAGMKSWHKVPRAFELADLVFEIHMSECCWAQFKRHRQCTMFRKSKSEDMIIPGAIRTIGRTRAWQKLYNECQDYVHELPEELTHIGNYLRLNGSPLSVLVKMNMREVYHFVRLRADEHAQWEIQNIAKHMTKIAKKMAPKASSKLCGKSDFK